MFSVATLKRLPCLGRGTALCFLGVLLSFGPLVSVEKSLEKLLGLSVVGPKRVEPIYAEKVGGSQITNPKIRGRMKGRWRILRSSNVITAEGVILC